MNLLLSLAIVMTSHAGGSATAPLATDSDRAATDGPAADKVVCRRLAETGSRVRKRQFCMTVREWQRVQDLTRDDVNEYLRKSTAGAPKD